MATATLRCLARDVASALAADQPSCPAGVGQWVAKLRLMGYASGELGVTRVDLKTDARNVARRAGPG